MPVNRYVLFCILAGAGVLADLFSKTYFFDRFHKPSEPMNQVDWWVNGVLGIQTSFNGGALFGMFQGGSFWLAGLSFFQFHVLVVEAFSWPGREH